ncbi:MAG: hypothetical protein KC653_00305 [Candidatus Andersenbacteria bacterium]|nr:hypothetical protein [Candidatus Andersenbacteria bacterium]
MDYVEKISQSAKYAKQKQYYRERIDMGEFLPSERSATTFRFEDKFIDSYKEMEICYDLYNNKIHPDHFAQYCPADRIKAFAGIDDQLINRDIVSSRINSILGVESSRPFKYQAMAVNPEATTIREEKENELLQNYITEMIYSGKVDKENTPPQIRKYIGRKFQVPQEMMANHVLQIGQHRQNLNTKFKKGLKHMALSSRQIYLVYPENGEPCVKVVNPMRVWADMGVDNDQYHLANSITAVYYMSPTEVTHWAKDEITSSQIDRIFELSKGPGASETSYNGLALTDTNGHVRVVHRVWRGLRKVGYLKYYDEQGVVQQDIVSENYKLNKEQGDIKITWQWVEEVHEGWKIADDIYVKCGPVPYQHVIAEDMQRPWLPYVGGIYDSLNSDPVSPMGRMIPYQYFYNIVQGTLDRLIARDRGKKLGMNMSTLPHSLGIDLKKFLNHMDEDDLILLNPHEEGMKNRGADGRISIADLVTSVDLSPSSQIENYQQLAELTYQRAGLAIGITPQMEGMFKEREAAANVQNSINLSSSKLDPFFQFHDQIRRDVLMAYLKLAQLMYYENPPKYLTYSSDDMTTALLKFDPEMFLAANYTIYINNSSKTHDAQAYLDRYLQAAMQSQTIQPDAALAAMRSESFHEAEEILRESAEETAANAAAAEKAKQEARMLELKAQADEKQRDRDHEIDAISLKAKEDRITRVATQIILAQGFNEEKDANNNNKADVEEFGQKIIDEARKMVEQEESAE